MSLLVFGVYNIYSTYIYIYIYIYIHMYIYMHFSILITNKIHYSINAVVVVKIINKSIIQNI